MTLYRFSLLGMFIACMYQCLHRYIYNGNPFKMMFLNVKERELYEKAPLYFHEDYLQARSAFKSQVLSMKPHFEFHSLPLTDLSDMDYSIDIAILRGRSDKVLLQISGTHGVEGFAGSAIQLALLKNESNLFARSMNHQDQLPTLIFIHALNPFGMARVRT